MGKRIILYLVFLLLFSSVLKSQRINISIFNKYSIQSIVISPVDGKYELKCGDKVIFAMKKHDVALLDIINDSIYVRTLTGPLGSYPHLEYVGVGKNNYYKIKAINPDFNPRDYDDDLLITIKNNKYKLINNVDLESYIEGVVQSEGGTKSPVEYYKCQAVICRTYALENLYRHTEEGFNLCDDVHCQAYYTKCLLSDDIVNATLDTKGLIIVDTTLSLITATFHSNCGGQTVGSEYVWLQPRSYLKSIKDPFCKSGRSASWTKTIAVSKWEQYLSNQGFNLNSGTFNINNYSFKQNDRETHYSFNGKTLPLKTIREDFKLRSTYFDIKHDGGEITLIGKGYGHGVGLCQEGAMEMAKQGYSYEQIIKYYYKNIFVVSLIALEFFKEDE